MRPNVTIPFAKAWAEDRKAGRKTLRKFLVFVSHRSTLERLARTLEEELATDVAVFHEPRCRGRI